MNGNLSHDGQNDGREVSEPAADAKLVLHRLADVRGEKGFSWFELARRMGITAEEVRLQEESIDVSISTLRLWSAALNVPITDLIVEPDEWANAAHLERSQAERLLRLAAKLRDRSRRRSVQRLAQTFVDQLTEIHPELDPSSNGTKRSVPETRSKRRTNGSRPGNKRREPPQ